jgi:hypothetical protein
MFGAPKARFTHEGVTDFAPMKSGERPQRIRNRYNGRNVAQCVIPSMSWVRGDDNVTRLRRPRQSSL